MKRTTAFALTLAILLLAAFPAFAAPTCGHLGCTGVMSIIRFENEEDTPDSSAWAEEELTWDYATQRYRLARYIFYSRERDVYRVCNKNPNHKEFLYHDWYTLRVFQNYVN